MGNIRIGINGFGRTGRAAARIIFARNDIALAAINSLSSKESHEYLLAHDSTYGRFDKALGSTMIFAEHDPANISWSKAEVDVVLECTGKFRTTEEAAKHKAEKVVISAPAKDNTPTYIMGVNHTSYLSSHRVVSNSSCSTNCITTTLKVLDDSFRVRRGSMTTVHALTDSQNLLDNSIKKEVRSRRSAMLNLIPATTGSAKDVAKLFPHLAGKLPCRAIRVPVPTVSMIELVVETEKSTTIDEVNRMFAKASESSLHGILAVASEELVSTDYIGSPFSSAVDPFLTDVVSGTLVHITAWYDNEWGYANRLVDLASYISQNR